MNWRLTFVSLALLYAQATLAQEELTPLTYVQTLPSEQQENSGDRINVLKHRFIYVIDTLSLPFFDDFSTNRIKLYDAQQDDPNVSLKIHYDFKVNGQAPVQLDYMTDTTYSTLKTVNGDTIKQSNALLHITFYVNGKPVGYDTGWTNVLTRFDQGSGIVSYDTLVPHESIINTPDTFFRVADDQTLWTAVIDTFDSLHAVPFINNRYAKNILTQGVASFDGTDERGYPYDISSATTYGMADVLTSKPLALDSNMSNVFLSFFYQAGGFGNQPDEEDSLVVEFFDVQDSTWRFARKIKTPEEEDTNFSHQVFIHVDGPKYLRSGFRFRFKNYATLSGNFDLWHIDYVRLGQDRDTVLDDSVINDVAFTYGVDPLLSPYRNVPYKHYLQNPSAFEADGSSFTIVNLSRDTVSVIGLQYEVIDPDQNVVGGESTAAPAVNPRTRLSLEFPINDSPVFPDLGSEFATFTLRSRYTSSSLANSYKINDTIFEHQELRDYYAYDDGSAEMAYSLNGAGVDLAYGFESPIGDSLRAIYFNFPQILHNNNEDLSIRLMVWGDLNAAPIYVGDIWLEPKYTDGNGFYRMPLEYPVYVKDQFYVGYEQLESKKIYVGLDKNTNASQYTYYRIGENWYQSSVRGAIMVRPSFSEEDVLGLHDWKTVKTNDLICYPNPAYTYVQFAANEPLLHIDIYDLTAKRVCSVARSAAMDVSGLAPGMYIARAVSTSGKLFTTKLLIH